MRKHLKMATMILCISTQSMLAHAAITWQFQYTDAPGVGFNAGNGVGAARQTALAQTGAMLSAYFPTANGTVRMSVNGGESTPGTLASAGSNASAGCVNGFQRGDVGTAALGGADPAPGQPHGTVNVNFSEVTWALGDSVPFDQFDFKNVMMHEILHAMGFAGAVQPDGGDYCGTPAGTPSRWVPFDQHMGNISALFINTSFAINVPAWQAAYTGGTGNTGLLWRGAGGVAVHGGPVPMYSPNPAEAGSSGSHLDTNFFVNTNYMMLHSVGAGPGPRKFSSIEQGILNDIGYQTGTTTPTPEADDDGLPVWLLWIGSQSG